MNKKLLSLAVITALSVGFTACGGGVKMLQIKSNITKTSLTKNEAINQLNVVSKNQFENGINRQGLNTCFFYNDHVSFTNKDMVIHKRFDDILTKLNPHIIKDKIINVKYNNIETSTSEYLGKVSISLFTIYNKKALRCQLYKESKNNNEISNIANALNTLKIQVD
jgi:hypothetical protein